MASISSIKMMLGLFSLAACAGAHHRSIPGMSKNTIPQRMDSHSNAM
jgi:hypothetical protein